MSKAADDRSTPIDPLEDAVFGRDREIFRQALTNIRGMSETGRRFFLARANAYFTSPEKIDQLLGMLKEPLPKEPDKPNRIEVFQWERPLKWALRTDLSASEVKERAACTASNPQTGISEDRWRLWFCKIPLAMPDPPPTFTSCIDGYVWTLEDCIFSDDLKPPRDPHHFAFIKVC